MNEIKCVIFDIDDTLYLERDYVRSGFERVGEWVQLNLGVLNFAQLAWRAFKEGTRGSTFDRVLRECGVEPAPELIGELVDLYRTHEPKIELLPDALDSLDGLHGWLALAGLTDGPLDSQRRKANALGLTRWLNPVVFTEELGPALGKPHVRGFELIQEETGFSGGECVYVADNPLKDFAGPKSVGWRTVRVRRRAGLHYSTLSNSEVDVEVSNLWRSKALMERMSSSLDSAEDR